MLSNFSAADAHFGVVALSHFTRWLCSSVADLSIAGTVVYVILLEVWGRRESCGRLGWRAPCTALLAGVSLQLVGERSVDGKLA